MKKNIVISGITKGIGASIATTFLKSGEYNAFGFARNIADFSIKGATENSGFKYFEREIYCSFNKSDRPCLLCLDTVDAQNPEQIIIFSEKLVGLTEKQGYNYQHTDVLINNIGIYKTGSLFSEPDTQWQELFDVNVHAAYYLTKYLYPTFQKGTHIFNICSVASKQIVQEAPSYSITKMALYGLTNAMRQELEPLGIKVTAILPGAVNTHSWKDAPPEIQDKILPAQDIADLVWNIYHLSAQSTVKEVEITPLPF